MNLYIHAQHYQQQKMQHWTANQHKEELMQAAASQPPTGYSITNSWKTNRWETPEWKDISGRNEGTQQEHLVIHIPQTIEIPALGISVETKTLFNIVTRIASQYALKKLLENPQALSELLTEEHSDLLAMVFEELKAQKKETTVLNLEKAEE